MKKGKKEKGGLVGNWTITRVNHYTGEIIDTLKGKNLIVNSGLEYLAKLSIGVHTTYFRAIAIGTDGTGAVNEDLALKAEYTRELATLSYEADFIAKFTKTFEFGSGVAEDIAEVGILDNSVAGGNLLNRFIVSPVKSVSADVDLIVTCELTFSRV